MTLHLELPTWAVVLLVAYTFINLALDIRTAYWNRRLRKAKAENERLKGPS